MSVRYFVDQPIASQHVHLGGNELHHLVHVMRASVGNGVTLFDGSGAEFSARIVGIGRTRAELEIIDRLEIDRELATEVTIGVAMPKGDRQKWLVEKSVELGVTRIVPLYTSRAVAVASKSARQRLGRFVVEASKQCGRNRLLEISQPVDVSEFLATCPTDARRVLADPRGSPLANPQANKIGIYIAIGPEGGFTSDELSTATNAKWDVISLGPRILRIETAAIAIASAAIFRV